MPDLPSCYLAQFDEPAGYLDFARYGPPARAAVTATAELSARSASAGVSTVDDLMPQERRAQAVAARLAGTTAEHVVLLPNTSLGLFQAAFNLPHGDVLASPGEFPANRYPWARAEQAGLLRVRALAPGPVTPERVRDALNPDVTTVAMSAVDFRTGYRADLAAVREVVGDRLLVVDGIQAFGAAEEPWPVADVLVCGGQKWLRAGWGTGFAALSDRALERMRPLLSGWTGAHDPGRFDGEVQAPAGCARAWSVTNPSPVAAAAFAAALEVVERAGVAAIASRIAETVAELETRIRAAGAETVSAPPGHRAGILAFTVPGTPPETVGAALAEGGIAATVRAEHVRLSPHATTGREAATRLSAGLARICQGDRK